MTLSRRDFIELSAFTGAGLSFGIPLGNPALAQVENEGLTVEKLIRAREMLRSEHYRQVHQDQLKILWDNGA